MRDLLYVIMPPGYELEGTDERRMVMLLKRPVYGAKQASRRFSLPELFEGCVCVKCVLKALFSRGTIWALLRISIIFSYTY